MINVSGELTAFAIPCSRNVITNKHTGGGIFAPTERRQERERKRVLCKNELLEILHKLYDNQTIERVPIETIVKSMFQVLFEHKLTVHNALFVIKILEKEVKRQSRCVLVTKGRIRWIGKFCFKTVFP